MTHSIPDADLARAVADASAFIASLFVGRGAYEKATASSLAKARELGRQLEDAHPWGRKAMIYAISPSGRQTFIPNYFQPDL